MESFKKSETELKDFEDKKYLTGKHTELWGFPIERVLVSVLKTGLIVNKKRLS
jgi:hypothetical protein